MLTEERAPPPGRRPPLLQRPRHTRPAWEGFTSRATLSEPPEGRLGASEFAPLFWQ